MSDTVRITAADCINNARELDAIEAQHLREQLERIADDAQAPALERAREYFRLTLTDKERRKGNAKLL